MLLMLPWYVGILADPKEARASVRKKKNKNLKLIKRKLLGRKKKEEKNSCMLGGRGYGGKNLRFREKNSLSLGKKEVDSSTM